MDAQSSRSNRTAVARPTLSNVVMLLALGLIWGTAFLGIALALDGFGPAQVAGGRLAIGALALSVLTGFAASTGPRPTRGHVPWLLTIGLFGTAVPFFLLAWGQTRVSSGFAGVAMSSVALFVLPMTHVLVPGDQMTMRKSIGFLMGFLGVAVLLGPGLLTEGWTGPETAGRLACIGAAACYAVASLTTRLAPPIDSLALARWQLIIGAACVVPVALMLEGVPKAPPAGATLALIGLALVPTALAAWMRVSIIRTAGPSFMSTVGFMVPLWAVLLGIVFLGEPVMPSLFAALALILGGMAISQWPTIRGLLR